MITPGIRLVAASAVCLLALAGCGGQGSTSRGSTSQGSTSQGSTSQPDSPAARSASGDLTVLAAASLTGSFTQIGKEFEIDHPGVRVTFSFGSSATLATQINQGAPADVFAAASPTTMTTVTATGNSERPVPFATNTLEIAVPPGNPQRISGLEDFANESRTVAVCAEQVPCGSAAKALFERAGILPRPDTYGADVKATLALVQQREVDAALVYKTDVIAAGDSVQGIAVPQAGAVVNTYPIAVLAESRSPDRARAFVAYVLSPRGQATLGQAGFGRP
jgi:molybdate transport system substrate-binding protein